MSHVSPSALRCAIEVDGDPSACREDRAVALPPLFMQQSNQLRTADTKE